MIKGVHQLTLRQNMLISLINQWTFFNGWMDSRADPCVDPGFFVSGGGGGGGGGGGPGPTARIQDIHTHTRTHAYILMYKQAHECSCTGRRIGIHVHV